MPGPGAHITPGPGGASTPAELGLGNVDNTSDVNKPVSTAQSTALALKVDKTITVNGHALDADVAVTKADVGLGNVDNTADADKPVSIAQAAALLLHELLANKGQPLGYAGLDSAGLLPATVIPNIAITDVYTVASQAAMLSIPCQKGDVAVRSDENKNYILQGTDPTVLSNWVQLLTPLNAVLSVAGRAGAVVIAAADLSDASANAVSLITAANYAAMKGLLAIAAGDVSGLGALATLSNITASLISDASANGRSFITAANYAAMKALLTLVKGDVGLGNVDNTTDVGKPVSTAQQTALDLKAPLASPSFTGVGSIQALIEKATVAATAATGTIYFDAVTQAVLFFTSNASANWTTYFRGDAGTQLNALMPVGGSLTLVHLVTQGATAYYPSAFQIDGNAVTPKWQGGTAPTAGNTSGIDVYVYTIIKTAAATYTILASQTQFK
jgi:hypothetical protein